MRLRFVLLLFLFVLQASMHRGENVHIENQTNNNSLAWIAVDTRRLVITFHTPADNNQTHHLPQNYSVIKQYGRRLILDLKRSFDLDTERAFFLVALRSVESVELDSLVKLQTLATVVQTLYDDDSERGMARLRLWNLLDTEPYSIHAEGVWRFTNSTPDVVVAVIDSGLAEVAKPLFLNLLEGYDFISDDGRSLDGDGRDPDSTDPGDTIMPCRSSGWHGTKVASILAARHDNEWGMRGVAQNCSVLPLRVLGECSMGYASDVADAIVWAAGGQINGIPSNPDPSRIISLSLSGQGACPGYLQSAVNQASSLGAMLMAAAGNNDQDVSDFFPANCEGVVAVAASTRKGTLASYSNWGSSVAITAPGGDMADPIMALVVHPLENSLAVTYDTGTSYAVPQVAAAAALYPNVSDAGFNFYHTPFAGASASLRLCGKGILSLRKGE